MISIRQGVFETNSSSSHVLVLSTPAELEAWRGSGELFIYPDGEKHKLVSREWLRNRLRDDGIDVNTYVDDAMVVEKGLPLFDVAVYRNYDALSYKVSQVTCTGGGWINEMMDVTGEDSHTLFGWYGMDFYY